MGDKVEKSDIIRFVNHEANQKKDKIWYALWVKKINKRGQVQDRMIALGQCFVYSCKKSKFGKMSLQRAGHYFDLVRLEFREKKEQLEIVFRDFKIRVASPRLRVLMGHVLDAFGFLNPGLALGYGVELVGIEAKSLKLSDPSLALSEKKTQRLRAVGKDEWGGAPGSRGSAGAAATQTVRWKRNLAHFSLIMQTWASYWGAKRLPNEFLRYLVTCFRGDAGVLEDPPLSNPVHLKALFRALHFNGDFRELRFSVRLRGFEDELVALLSHTQAVHTLALSRSQLAVAFVPELCAALRREGAAFAGLLPLRRLLLSGVRIGDRSAAAFAEQMLHGRALETVELVDANLGGAGLETVCEGLLMSAPHALRLRRLVLDGNAFDAASSKALASLVIGAGRTLRELSLAGAGVGLATLCAAMRDTTVPLALQLLDLSGVDGLRDTSGGALRELTRFLRATPSLRVLKCARVGLTPGVFARIVQALSENVRLYRHFKLLVPENPALFERPERARDVVAALALPRLRLHTVSFNECRAGDDGLQALLTHLLRRKVALRVLCVSRNVPALQRTEHGEARRKTAQLLCRYLSSPRCRLLGLELQGLLGTYEFGSELAIAVTAMARNATLVSLDLTGNRAAGKTVSTLAQALGHNESLEELHLDENAANMQALFDLVGAFGGAPNVLACPFPEWDAANLLGADTKAADRIDALREEWKAAIARNLEHALAAEENKAILENGKMKKKKQKPQLKLKLKKKINGTSSSAAAKKVSSCSPGLARQTILKGKGSGKSVAQKKMAKATVIPKEEEEDVPTKEKEKKKKKKEKEKEKKDEGEEEGEGEGEGEEGEGEGGDTEEEEKEEKEEEGEEEEIEKQQQQEDEEEEEEEEEDKYESVYNDDDDVDEETEESVDEEEEEEEDDDDDDENEMEKEEKEEEVLLAKKMSVEEEVDNRLKMMETRRSPSMMQRRSNAGSSMRATVLRGALRDSSARNPQYEKGGGGGEAKGEQNPEEYISKLSNRLARPGSVNYTAEMARDQVYQQQKNEDEYIF